jgi:predicted Zn-dependent peptidase
MDNPDYFAVEVMNRIFGTEGFSSRLMQRIRTEKGLTYGIFGGIDADFTHDGVTTIYTFTKSPSVVEAVQATKEEVKLLMDKGVTQEELDRARTATSTSSSSISTAWGRSSAACSTTPSTTSPQDFILKTKAAIEE